MVKICKNCGQKLHENTQLCPDCGGTEFTAQEGNIQDYEINSNVITTRDMKGSGNILLGVLGAFLLSLVGGLIYFAFYQIGIITGITGIIIYCLSQFGYKKFSGCNNSVSLGGLISSIILVLTVIFLAHYVSVSFDIFQTYELKKSFIDILLTLPECLYEGELYEFFGEEGIYALFVQDLIFAYVFAFVAIIGDIIRIIKFRR